MSKLFFDVFPELKVNQDMEKLLADVEVTKVSTNRQRDRLRVYLLSTRLIWKSNIFHLENNIKKQLFPHHDVSIKIIEKYQLSGQYNPQKLMDVYKDSILEEFREYSLLEYNVLRMAKMEFPEENKLILTLEDSVIARQRTEEIVQILEKIICERCGMDINIQVNYVEPQEKKYKKNSDIQIENEVKSIVSKSSLAQGHNAEEPELVEVVPSEEMGEAAPFSPDSVLLEAAPVPEKKEEKKEAPKGEKPKGGFKKGGFSGGYGGGFKRSDNPDVVYGRDFDEETIEIKEILGEMGEVVIRGQILSLETREIRNEKTIIMFAITDFTDTIMVKMFSKNEFVPDITAEVKKGAFLKIKGVTTIDKFDGEDRKSVV